MILESAQLLSTAHRLLDGTEIIGSSKTGRKVKRWVLPDSREALLYHATHVNHPSSVWSRRNAENYTWLAELTTALCSEYTYRYGKTHRCELIGLIEALKQLPTNIDTKESFTQPTPAMPDEYKVTGDSILSYRRYYKGEKARMAAWKNRETPDWW